RSLPPRNHEGRRRTASSRRRPRPQRRGATSRAAPSCRNASAPCRRARCPTSPSPEPRGRSDRGPGARLLPYGPMDLVARLLVIASLFVGGCTDLSSFRTEGAERYEGVVIGLDDRVVCAVEGCSEFRRGFTAG